MEKRGSHNRTHRLVEHRVGAVFAMSIPVGKLVKRNMHLRVDDRLPVIADDAHRYARMTDVWHRMHPLKRLIEDGVKSEDDEDTFQGM